MDFNLRKKRLEKELSRQLNWLVSFGLDDAVFQTELISITKVRLDNELKEASIFFTLLRDQQKNKILKKLYASRSFLRHSLRKKIRMGYIPELKFFFDKETLEENDVLDILEGRKPS